eukprot:6004886-Pyramimonas_sp.AAC.1
MPGGVCGLVDASRCASLSVAARGGGAGPSLDRGRCGADASDVGPGVSSDFGASSDRGSSAMSVAIGTTCTSWNHSAAGVGGWRSRRRRR